MNIRTFALAATGLLFTLTHFTSCSLGHLAGGARALKLGVKYEVRKALEVAAPFDSSKAESRFFVINQPKPPLKAASKPVAMKVRTTAYTHNESDHLIYGKKNAVGTNLKFGTVRSAAADWSRYPVGTRFRIKDVPGVVYEVDDYGSALVGSDTIDRYKPSHRMMNAWGVRHVDIEVLHWGSYERSRQLIEQRTRYPHVRQMFDELENRLGEIGIGSSKHGVLKWLSLNDSGVRRTVES